VDLGKSLQASRRAYEAALARHRGG
jgi:hypothetical protein